MMLGMVVFWGTIIALVVWLVRGGPRSRDDAPHEVLRRRLADGSISVEEYQQRRAALESTTRSGDDDTPRADTRAGPSPSVPIDLTSRKDPTMPTTAARREGRGQKYPWSWPLPFRGVPEARSSRAPA